MLAEFYQDLLPSPCKSLAGWFGASNASPIYLWESKRKKGNQNENLKGFLHIDVVYNSTANNLFLQLLFVFVGFDVSGFAGCTEVGSPSTFQSFPEHADHKTAANAPTPAVGKAIGSVGGGEEDPAKKNAGRGDGMKEMERNMMEEMPCVSTKGDGPNGRRIEGFLYKYKKGGEVRIVCVCHGSFLTPAEFVRHAGGGDVAHPLRHIVVNPSPFAFF